MNITIFTNYHAHEISDKLTNWLIFFLTIAQTY